MADVAPLNAPVKEDTERDQQVIVFRWGGEWFELLGRAFMSDIGELTERYAAKEPPVIVHCPNAAELLTIFKVEGNGFLVRGRLRTHPAKGELRQLSFGFLPSLRER